jgi:single-stranded-DNA-specific exonuclease
VREWIEPQEISVPEEVQATIGGHPLVAQTLARRGFAAVEEARAFLDPALYDPAPPTDLPGLTKAVERLQKAIGDREKICVWGDFDVDGQTATTLLFCTLGDLGAVVQYHIPVRATESHGLNVPVLAELIADGIDLVLTCDTGVTAHEAIDYALERGVEVVVTDHHDLPPVLPQASAVVNPKILPDEHPLRELSGVGCAYKLAEALYEKAGLSAEATQYLDLVALGLVADVAIQTGDTRYLLQRGLQALRRTRRLGLQAMMEITELNPQWLTEEHIGFVLGPRLNALGRLADANVGVEFLTTEDQSRARILAYELEGLNARRKLLSDQVLQAAEAQIDRDPSLLERSALVLSHPSWSAGVIGIVASRLVERYGKPTVLIATPPGKVGRGSARSVEGCNISAAISMQADLLRGFGGHRMAAGLSIDPERISHFRRALSHTVSEMVGEAREAPALRIASYLLLPQLSLGLVEELERLAPFGPGNPPPILATKRLELKSHSSVGRSGEHLQLIVEDEDGNEQKVIWWQGAGWWLPEGRFDLAYVVRASDFRGQRQAQMEWVDARPVEAPAVAVAPERPPAEVFDHRAVPDPLSVLERLRATTDVQVWSEAQAKREVGGGNRYELGPSEALAIWTTPPGPRELAEALESVTPQRVYLFAIDAGLDRPEPFLKRLAGLIKHALRADDGRACVAMLAAATAQRVATVRVGVAWLSARGQIVVLSEDGDELQLRAGDRKTSAESKEIAAQLRALLDETAAYRAHFARAAPETLFEGGWVLV